MSAVGKRKLGSAVSNIGHERPYVGMRLEIMDSEMLWSSGYLVDVDERKNPSETWVTVASDGWGRTWDETILWPNNRLAQPYTYTKRVKCLVDMLRPVIPRTKPSRKLRDSLPKGAHQGYATVWPCTVQFRMPHPEETEYGEAALHLEEKIFIQPYAAQLLPDVLRPQFTEDGGAWYTHTRLRLWRDDVSMLGILLHPEEFLEAYHAAKNDTSVKGYLLPKALVPGTTLLDEPYRVLTREGADVKDGVLRHGGGGGMGLSPNLAGTSHSHQKRAKQAPPSVVQVGPLDDGDYSKPTAEDDETRGPPRSMPPPTLPPSLEITEPIYPNCGVQKCQTSNEWIASVSRNGSEVFLGTFPTQTQAWQATRLAVGDDDVEEVEQDRKKAEAVDMKMITASMVVDAFEKQYDPSIHTFSLHKYTIDRINYRCYQQEMKRYNMRLSGESGLVAPKSGVENKRKGKRKQMEPKKIMLSF